MMKTRNTVDLLPEDLVVEILSRVPEASLARFQSVSKGWNSLIKKEVILSKKSLILMLIDFRIHSASVDLHGIQKNVVKLTNQFSLKDTLCNPSKEVDIRNVYHCDGLLLCTTKDKRLVVWNPRSGDSSWVKPRIQHEKIGVYALGKSSCNKYKILRTNQFCNRDRGLVEHEVYDFTSKSWRVTVGDETRDWCIIGLWPCGMSVNGNTYWLADGKDGRFILGFDFSTERFGSVSLPPGDKHSPYYVCGLSVTRQEQQQLCLLTIQRSLRNDIIIDLWRATKIESSGATSWSKFLSVDLADLNHPFRLVSAIKFLADREKRVLVCPGEEGNSNSFLLILGEDKYIQVDHHDARVKCSLLVNYVPTLVQIQ